MQRKNQELDFTLNISNVQKIIYKPTSFWKNACKNITDDIYEFGIENFRSFKRPSFFVPTYGVPGNSFSDEMKNYLFQQIEKNGTKKQLLAFQQFINGYNHALSDYRVFLSSNNENINPLLNNFSENEYGKPLEQFIFNNKKYSRSSLNYILGLCFLKKHLKHQEEIKTVLEIGGGFGSLGEILKNTKGLKYIDIDIPPVSFIAHKYLKNVYGDSNIEPYINNKENIIIKDLKPCSVFNSWDIEKLEGVIDLFVNFISFQEMEPNIVENYLKHVKRLNPNWILLRNIKEGKNKKINSKAVGVKIPIKSIDYIEMLNDKYSLLDSNVFPFGYKTVDGFNSELLLFKKNQ